MANGKGDKPRFYPNSQYRNNYDKIFKNKKESKMKDKGYTEEHTKLWMDSVKDKCVMCGATTPYTKDTHIDERLHYIEGAGQMCKDCHTKIY